LWQGWVMSATSVGAALEPRLARRLSIASLGLAFVASVAVAAAALVLPIDSTDEVGPTVGAAGQVLSPGSPSVPESIYQRNGWIVLVYVGVPILLTLLVGVLLVAWMRTGARATRRTGCVVAGTLALGGLVGLVTFLVGGAFLLIAALLIVTCLIAPPPDTNQDPEGRQGVAGSLSPVL